MRCEARPLISVLMPIYNVEKFLADALLSILNQSYENIELIIVDDCSTDTSYDIARRLTENRHNVKIARNEKNLKIAATLNIALAMSRGKYIARMDGDDISEPDRLERYFSKLESDPELGIVGSSVISIDEEGREVGRTVFFEDFNLIKKTLKYRTPCAHIWLARREVYDTLAAYRDMPGAEDYDFLLRAISSGFKISNIEDYYGYKVRLFRAGNTLNSLGLRQKLLHRYIYRLYQERISGKHDSFTAENLAQSVKVGKFENYIFNVSSMWLNKSIKHKANGAMLRSALYAVASCISPHQLIYLLGRVALKLKVRASV